MKGRETEQIFYSLIRAGLWETEARFKPYHEIQWDDIYRIAEEQSVVVLVMAGIEHITDYEVPQIVKFNFFGVTLQMAQCNKEMNLYIGELIKYLREKEIYTLLVKGQGSAQCYERPLWRTCGDIDLFLSSDNYERAKPLLKPKATKVEEESMTSKHQGMTIDGRVVELHGVLHGSLSHRINKVLKGVMDETFFEGAVRSWENGNVLVFLLDANNDIIYTFTHFLGHFYKGGIGLRQICDWNRLLWTYRGEIDLTLLKKRLRLMGLMSEWKAFGAFSVDYLGMPAEAMPFYTPGIKWKRKADRISDFIIEVGNFGHNRDNSSSFVVRKTKAFVRRCGDLWRHSRIFPLDSYRFFPNIVIYGLRSLAKR